MPARPREREAHRGGLAPVCQKGEVLVPTIPTTPATTTPLRDCPAAWTRLDTACYWVSEESLSWVGAEQGCRELSPRAHLAWPRSSAEQDLLASLHSDTGGFYWLGATDSRAEGNWTWTDGSVVEYSAWGPAEGSGGQAENCAALRGGEWHDRGCFDRHFSMCQIDLGASQSLHSSP
jgi:hypothetical protein